MRASNNIEVRPVGFVRKPSSNKNVRDKSLVSRIVLKKDLVKTLDGIEEFSYVFIVYRSISNVIRLFLEFSLALLLAREKECLLKSKLIEYSILFLFLKYVVLTRNYTVSKGT